MPNLARRRRTASENENSHGPFALLIFLARQERLREAASQTCTVLSVAAAGLLLLIAIDHLMTGGLSAGWRMALLVGGLTAVLGGLGITIARAAGQRVNLAYIAQRVERAGGIRNDALVNAVLVDAMETTAYARPAALEQAAAAVARAPHELPADRAALRPLMLAAVVALAWIAYIAVVPKSTGVSLLRLLGADLPAPTATRIALIRPAADEIVRANTALELEFEFSGAPVETVTLRLAGADHDRQAGETIPAIRRTRSPAGADRRVFALAPFQVQSDVAYRCAAGDAALEGTIRVRPTPALESLEITLTPPAYTRRPPQVATERDLTVLAGTRASLRLATNTALKQAVLIYAEAAHESRTRFRIDDTDLKRATLERPLIESGVYRVEITDDAGLTMPTDVRGRVTVRPDEPPRFLGVREVGSLSGDAFVQSVESRNRWPLLEAAATDDVAVERAWFVVQVGDAITRTALDVTTGDDPAVVLLNLDLNDALAPDTTAASAWFEAQDGLVLPDGRAAPQTTRSPTIQLSRKPPPSAAAPPQPDEAPPAAAPRADSPASQPADSEPSAGEPSSGGATTDASEPANSDSGTPADSDQPIDEAVDQFIRDHGQEAAEADRVRQNGGGEGDSKTDESSQPPNESAGNGGSPGQPAEGEAVEGQNGGEPGQKPSGDALEPSGEGESKPGNQAQQDGEAPPAPGEAAPPGDGPAQPGEGEANSDTPGAGQPGGGDAARAAVRELIEAAERGDGVSADELIKAGWPAAKANAFIRNLTHLRERLRKDGGIEVLRSRTGRPPTAEPALRPGETRTVAPVQVAPEESWEDRLRMLAPPAGERVPDDLRAVLEAYYRAVAERAAKRGSK